MMAIASKAAMSLINKEITPLRFALIDPPIVAIKVVTQVPMVAPKTIYIALAKLIAPLPTITMTIPVVALLDCTKAVSITPNNKSNNTNNDYYSCTS